MLIESKAVRAKIAKITRHTTTRLKRVAVVAALWLALTGCLLVVYSHGALWGPYVLWMAITTAASCIALTYVFQRMTVSAWRALDSMEIRRCDVPDLVFLDWLENKGLREVFLRKSRKARWSKKWKRGEPIRDSFATQWVSRAFNWKGKKKWRVLSNEWTLLCTKHRGAVVFGKERL